MTVKQESKERIALQTNSRSIPTRGRGPFCTYCKKNIRERCWSFHGKPACKGGERAGRGTSQHKFTKKLDQAHKETKGSELFDLTRLIRQVASQVNIVINSDNIEKGKLYFPQTSSLLAVNSFDFWILNSGANKHMIGNKNLLHDYHRDYASYIKVANGSYLLAIGYGTAYISYALTLEHVLFVPNCTCNLISVSTLMKEKSHLIFFMVRKWFSGTLAVRQ